MLAPIRMIDLLVLNFLLAGQSLRHSHALFTSEHRESNDCITRPRLHGKRGVKAISQNLLSSMLLSVSAASPAYAFRHRLTHKHEHYLVKACLRQNGQSMTRPLTPHGLRHESQPLMNTETLGSTKVAVVIGASRGIGKGIALELGIAGYLVYVAGRSTRAGGETMERPMGPSIMESNIDQTCDEIIAFGGKAVPVACDVGDDSSISALFRRVQEEQGRLDVLVCSAFSIGDAAFKDMTKEFWQQGAKMWDGCHGAGLRGNYMASVEAAPLLIDTAKHLKDQDSRPLIVLVSSFGGQASTFNVAYGVGKAACDRLAKDMAYQLRPYGVDSISIYPGIVRTEGNLELERRGDWADVSGGLDLEQGETPRFTGRAVVALAARPDLAQIRSGDVQVVAELASELGFTDVDGSVPLSIRDLRFLVPNYVFPEIERQAGNKIPTWLKSFVPSYLIPWSVFSAGPPPPSD